MPALLDNVSTGPASRCPGSTTYTWNHTVSAGDNRVLLVGTQIGTNPTDWAVVTGVTFNGVAMTFVRADINNTPSPRLHTEWWYLVAPDVGTFAIVVTYTTFGGTSIGDGCGISFTGADQTGSVIDAHNGSTGSTTSVSTSVTTVTAGAFIVDILLGAGGWGLTKDAAQTQIDNVVAVACGGSGYLGTAASYRGPIATPGSTSMAWTIANSEQWAHSVIAIKPYIAPDGISGAGNIASGEAFGTLTVHQQIRPTGIASVEAFGTMTVNVRVVPTGIGSLEAFGTPQLNLQVRPTSVDSAELFGTARMILKVTPSGVATLEAFGDPVVSAGGLIVVPTAIASAEAFGTDQIDQQIRPTGLAGAEAFGTAKLNQVITPDDIASDELFGSHLVSAGELIIIPNGIGSLEVFGTATLHQQIIAQAIASAEAFGDGRIVLYLLPTGIASGEAFGTDQVNLQIRPSGILTGEAIGDPTLINTQVITPDGIASGLIFGTPVLVPGPVTLVVSAIGSGEAFGTAAVVLVSDQEAYRTVVAQGRVFAIDAQGRVFTVDAGNRVYTFNAQGGT